MDCIYIQKRKAFSSFDFKNVVSFEAQAHVREHFMKLLDWHYWICIKYDSTTFILCLTLMHSAPL
jgi:hypothetical protein